MPSPLTTSPTCVAVTLYPRGQVHIWSPRLSPKDGGLEASPGECPISPFLGADPFADLRAVRDQFGGAAVVLIHRDRVFATDNDRESFVWLMPEQNLLAGDVWRFAHVVADEFAASDIETAVVKGLAAL